MVNPWQWHDRNPYEQTDFQILDIDPAAERATIRTRIAARRKRISYDAGRFPLFGQILGVAQINAAEEHLATPATRIAAELITHRTESGGVDIADQTALLELAESLGTDDDPRSDTAPGPGHELALDYRILPMLLPPPVWEMSEHLDEETAE